MEWTDKGRNNAIKELYEKYGAILIDTHKFTAEADRSDGWAQSMRVEGRGPKYVIFGKSTNASVRYRIDHVIDFLYAFGTNMHGDEESKNLMLQCIEVKNGRKSLSKKEAIKLYDFHVSTYDRYLKDSKKKNLMPVGKKMGSSHSSSYVFLLDYVLDHIFSLKYIKTV